MAWGFMAVDEMLIHIRTSESLRANVSHQHDISPAVLCGVYSQQFSQAISFYCIICTHVSLSLISAKVVLEKQFLEKTVEIWLW